LTRGKALLLICIFTVSLYTVVGSATPNGKPFQELWEAIEFLQEQIATIELTPGPEGPQGPTGPAGPEGSQGLPGEDGTDGQDAPGGIIVGILDPDYGETLSGNVTIRAIIFGSEDYTLSILRNGTEIGTTLPMEWNSLTVDDGWWNITIVATDMATNDLNSDEVIVNVKNFDITYLIINPNLIVPGNVLVFFNFPLEGIVHSPNSFTNRESCIYRFVIPNNYDTEEDITFHIVWGASIPMSIDYRITFSYTTDGNSPVRFYDVISSWTSPGQRRRNFESFTRKDSNLSGNLVMLEISMEDQNNLDFAVCYGVWLEVPVK
jgi:hypothetical protein